jgi:hypothetical protein
MNIKEISYDPSTDEILGVVGKNIHIKIYDANEEPIVLILAKKLFHKTWDNWIKGKKDYCERYKHYCGVMGYTFIEEGEILKDKIKLYEYKDEHMKEVDATVIKVIKFNDYHDFEHG